MAKSRPKAPTGTSPKGILKYPRISAPDYGTKDYPTPNGVYKADLILKKADGFVQVWLATLQPYFEEAVRNGETAFKALKAETRKKLGSMKVNELYTELLDPDTEQPTGDIAVRFKLEASRERTTGEKKGTWFDNRPAVFSANGQLLIPGFMFRDRGKDEEHATLHAKGQPDIWGGTLAKVSYEVGTNKEGAPGYFIPGTGAAGLSLKLRGVQVIELVSAGARNASDYGFGDESGGEEQETADDNNGGDF
jgi:hypothetical protein